LFFFAWQGKTQASIPEVFLKNSRARPSKGRVLFKSFWTASFGLNIATLIPGEDRLVGYDMMRRRGCILAKKRPTRETIDHGR
jgi:hypothetical protein